MLVTIRVPRGYYRTVVRLTKAEGGFFGITDESGNSFVFKVEGVTCVLVASTIPGPLMDVLAKQVTLCVCMAESNNCEQLRADGNEGFPFVLEFIDRQARPIVVSIHPETLVEYWHERSHAMLYQRIKLIGFGDVGMRYLYQAVPDPTGIDPNLLLLRGRRTGISSYFPIGLFNVSYERQAAGAMSRGKTPRTRKWISDKRAHLKHMYPDFDYSDAIPTSLRPI